MTTKAEGVRAQARTRMRGVILDTARAHLAEHGAGGLSLRAVARDVGMVSSALYRYFDSRDALLTALIIDAYDGLGDAVEAAEGTVTREDLTGRWAAICRTTRDWALADPQQYALVYGSPVPGYAAPQDTVGPATRVTRLLADLLGDVAAAGRDDGVEVTPAVAAAVAPARAFAGDRVSADLMVRGLMAWTYLFGAVSFELFGQRHRAVADDGLDVFFAEETARIGRLIGLS
ncbi:TetR/AcrR family transcriptional regulator [Jannaschia sp. R86511]|uniref:TetR/AcrR family transcriptional regulator n=1 Tax=Jannaschia sp. R86511 TaxID=3093853 RepID=UPI0036D23092